MGCSVYLAIRISHDFPVEHTIWGALHSPQGHGCGTFSMYIPQQHGAQQRLATANNQTIKIPQQEGINETGQKQRQGYETNNSQKMQKNILNDHLAYYNINYWAVLLASTCKSHSFHVSRKQKNGIWEQHNQPRSKQKMQKNNKAFIDDISMTGLSHDYS